MSPEKLPFTRAKPPPATTRGIVADSIPKAFKKSHNGHRRNRL